MRQREMLFISCNITCSERGGNPVMEPGTSVLPLREELTFFFLFLFLFSTSYIQHCVCLFQQLTAKQQISKIPDRSFADGGCF